MTGETHSAAVQPCVFFVVRRGRGLTAKKGIEKSGQKEYDI